MGEIVFVGLGLYDCSDITVGGLEVIKTADRVFLEHYTSVVPELDVGWLRAIVGKDVEELDREALEVKGGESILKAAERGTAVLLVPGDPFIATTHIALKLEARKRGIRVKVFHAPSILSAVIGVTGLQVYRFGRCATLMIPREEYDFIPMSSYQTLRENWQRGLHTLLLLEIDVTNDRYMSIKEGVDTILKLSARESDSCFSPGTLGVGAARVGSPTEKVAATSLSKLKNMYFEPPPYCMVIPARLHILEAEALILFGNGDREMIEKWLK